MQTGYVTTGIRPLAIGSVETFRLRPRLGGLPWNLAGGTVTLKVADPIGNVQSYTASILGYAADVTLAISGLAGLWLRAWFIVDANGITQVSDPIGYEVISSPV